MKQEVHTLTGSRNAVRLPAHITLIPPWRQAARAEETLCTELRDFAALEEGFSVGLQGFDWFGNRTLFVRVTEAAALQAFHADLMGWCASRLENIPLKRGRLPRT